MSRCCHHNQSYEECFSLMLLSSVSEYSQMNLLITLSNGSILSHTLNRRRLSTPAASEKVAECRTLSWKILRLIYLLLGFSMEYSYSMEKLFMYGLQLYCSWRFQPIPDISMRSDDSVFMLSAQKILTFAYFFLYTQVHFLVKVEIMMCFYHEVI